MYKKHPIRRSRPAACLSLIIVMAAALAGCAETEAERRLNLQQDIITCEDFGAEYGSREHTQCMLIQQQRRDGKTHQALERARIASEIQRNTQEAINAREQADD